SKQKPKTAPIQKTTPTKKDNQKKVTHKTNKHKNTRHTIETPNNKHTVIPGIRPRSNGGFALCFRRFQPAAVQRNRNHFTQAPPQVQINNM
ncbi:MAG: hypothetical protein SOS98_06230, partial [Varibaculum sp.]|nr:hypothetical protein [Varibaculum sp.]